MMTVRVVLLGKSGPRLIMSSRQGVDNGVLDKHIDCNSLSAPPQLGASKRTQSLPPQRP